MNKTFSLLLIVFISVLYFIGCKGNSDKDNTDQNNSKESEKQTLQNDSKVTDISGNYVSDGYDQRNEGYDWVSVSVKKLNNDEISVSIRSRADKKKPTCTFDTKAKKITDSSYSAVADGKNILITFTNKSVKIAGAKPEDENALNFFCSGGATISGTYNKINGGLDESQIDKTLFNKVLSLQNLSFSVTSTPKNGKVELEIFPIGLKLDNQTIKYTIDGTVVDAEVEDLNGDGFPEVVVFTQSGENKKGNVYAASVLGGKSMVQINFPPFSDNPKINKGYNGFDEFTLIENYLSQRFPLFENGNKTGKFRQIEYSLQKGENMPVFVVKNITEY